VTGPGNGTVWLRIDHDLIGRALAEKLKRRSTADSSFRIAEPDAMDMLNRRRVASGRVG